MLNGSFGLNEYGDDHVFSVRFMLSVPLYFHINLLRVKRELTIKQGDALIMSCALSELF